MSSQQAAARTCRASSGRHVPKVTRGAGHASRHYTVLSTVRLTVRLLGVPVRACASTVRLLCDLFLAARESTAVGVSSYRGPDQPMVLKHRIRLDRDGYGRIRMDKDGGGA